ncbi:MAG: preprotein translocase, SecG subunit [Bacteroidota bacterium]|nr:preprotein translocase, SecG subunit [Bacteroidota bacterium]
MAFVTVLIILVCVLLGAAVLIQNPKGGGLNASFGGVGQQLLGARRSTDVVEKSTWVLAFALLFLCLSTAFFVPKNATTKKDQLPKSEIEQMQMKTPFNVPTTGGAKPAGQQPAPAQPAQQTPTP